MKTAGSKSELGTWMAARRARRAFSSRIRFLSSSFFCCCSRRHSSSALSSHSWKGKIVLMHWQEKEKMKPVGRMENKGWRGGAARGRMDTFRLLERMRLRAVWFVCCLLAWRLYQRWMVTAAWFTCWINLQIHKRAAMSHTINERTSTERYKQCGSSPLKQRSGSDLSASSSVTSLLRGGTGLPRWADTGDLLFEVEETEEKFFWDFVREPFSSDTSSFAVAFRMLLKERYDWEFWETSHKVLKHQS